MRVLYGIIIFFSVCLILLIGIGVYFAVISTGKIQPFHDKNGQILEGSISEKTIVELNGANNGLIIRGKNTKNPVLLFVSSGPGTSDYFFNELYPSMNLDEFFTVCYWDYRGMCLVYDKNMDPASVTAKVLIEDTKAVTEYLKRRFDKQKIFIMGFSGGTHIALQAVAAYPQDFHAYFAMSQVVCSGKDNDTYIYEFMKKVFTERKQTSLLNKLEALVEHLADGTVVCKKWPPFIYLLHLAGGGTLKDKTEITGIDIPIFNAHCYTMKEKFDYVPGLKFYRRTAFYKETKKIDYRKDFVKIGVPVYFISGNYDYNCPWPLVKEYHEILEAPDKDFLLVEDAAHSPLWEKSEPVVEFMKSKIALLDAE